MRTIGLRRDTRFAGFPRRREVVALLGMSGVALLARAIGARAATGETDGALPLCVARPEQTEGPYFVEEDLNRSDIRSDPRRGSVSMGFPLRLMFRVSRMIGETCTALAGAQVDIWHCDAAGRYSDVTGSNFKVDGPQFLRGHQLTDEAGNAGFLTIYPGWYEGRCVHIHFKIRTPPRSAKGYQFTSQLYFDDALTDRVHAIDPYASRGPRSMRNADDGIFRRGGRQLLLEPEDTAQGYTATFDIGLRI
jgi:protocatechuate 3,4-dioxygenase beta subunit